MKKAFYALLSLCLLLPFCLAAPMQARANDGEYPYVITDYAIQMDVAEDNILRITETIQTQFNEARHGIYRRIPTSPTISRADGTTDTIHAKIRHLQVNEKYDASTENGEYVVQIGDADKTVTGPKEYVLSYEYHMGKDASPNYDELYYNLIGTGWDTSIAQVHFTITMPKPFDEKKLGFSTGGYGTAGTESIAYAVNGQTITGAYEHTLEPHEGLTVRLELPQGYFKFNMAAYYAQLSLLVVLPLALAAALFILWNKFGKDKKMVDVVEFYPPDGLNSAETALWYKGAATQEAIISLLIYLANKGYLSIESGKGGRSFTIHKKKDYDGHNNAERDFLAGLWKTGNTVTKRDLQDSFYETVGAIAADLNGMENRKQIFSAKSMRLCAVGWLLCIAVLGGVIALFSQILGGFEKYLFLGAGLCFIVIGCIFSSLMPKRTENGAARKQQINGFKIFLETAEKEKLEALVDENPEYFYDILPYAYVLGVSDRWIRQFEGIAVEPPQWYSGYGPFQFMMLHTFMHNTMGSVSQAMTSVPQSSVSSGGGGGFSGGGAGGGGGGSW